VVGIDHIPAGVEFDFMTDVALPLPIAVAAAWLGPTRITEVVRPDHVNR
jgi:hypothetical protein